MPSVTGNKKLVTSNDRRVQKAVIYNVINNKSLGRKEVLQMIKDLQKQGMSQRQIAEHLNNQNIPTFSGRGIWQRGTISNLIKKEQGG
ncbi:MAG: recombinase family protein [Deltaproteobacteria bacterium]|nr:recombinase family protein [Deltaproteobacteria bacterium]